MVEITSFTGEYRWLSNFWPVKIPFGKIEYPSVEHAYQASKTESPELRLAISQLKTAGMAKRISSSIVQCEYFKQNKLLIMSTFLNRKFMWPDLKKKLIDTKGAELIEGNNWGDTYWGVCNGIGENNLGKLIMEIRACLI